MRSVKGMRVGTLGSMNGTWAPVRKAGHGAQGKAFIASLGPLCLTPQNVGASEGFVAE